MIFYWRWESYLAMHYKEVHVILMHWGLIQSVYIKEQWRLLTWIDCPSVTYDDVGFMKTIGCSGTGLPCSAANALKENIRIKIYPLDNQYFFYVNSTCRKRLELFQKHIWLPRCKIQNYYLYVQGIMNSELCTRQNETFIK